MENDKFIKVSVFMNVFNCHVNRFPIDCKVSEVFYKPGDFVNASWMMQVQIMKKLN